MGKTKSPTHPLWRPVDVPPVNVEVVDIQHDILAVSKPVGMDTIQDNGWVTGYPNLKDVVYGEFPYARFLNRIDRNTSGLVLFALSKEMRAYLCSIWFGAGSIENRRKIYLAVIERPEWVELENDQPLRKAGKWEEAHTAFKVLRYRDGLALVSAELVSHGRTHQIRKHLRDVGSPILGDLKYGGRPYPQRKGQLLHAWKNLVKLPNGEWLNFQSKVPEDFPIAILGGTVKMSIPVQPLDVDGQLDSFNDYRTRQAAPELKRKEGEAYPDYLKRRAYKQRWIDDGRPEPFDPHGWAVE